VDEYLGGRELIDGMHGPDDREDNEIMNSDSDNNGRLNLVNLTETS
jgi:hypothetical protein